MEKLEKIRHSLAHLLAAAVLKEFPTAKLGIGPVIENGFYYDFKLPKSLTPDDLEGFEMEMRRLIKAKLSFTGRKVKPAEAKKIFKAQPFKLELIKDFVKDRKPLTVYITGNLPKKTKSKDLLDSKFYILNSLFVDLCRGGHVKNTKEINPDGFKLTHIAGAYWKGSEKNPQLQRIYGLAFATKKELTNHLRLLEEAKKRDHREIGKKLKLFTAHELIGSGLPIWLPNGTIIKDEIEKFAKETEEAAGYLRISTPHVAKEELFKTSGHLPYYKETMFPGMKLDDGTYYLKAMNCPMAHLAYKAEPRSYRDLPVRLAEYGTVYRNELSGALAGLLRVRMLSMNDAHIYCRADQIEEEFKAVMKMTMDYFSIFGLKDYYFRLSLWDPKNKKKYINEPKNWQLSEKILKKVLHNLKVKFTEVKNEAAFYGPKVDIQFKSIIGREESMSTIQLDFAAKKRFDLTYKDKNGKEANDVFVIHRAPLSTHERFLAFLIEHYAGDFPTWLAPQQVAVMPIGENHKNYALKIAEELKAKKIRTEMFAANETLGKRIREAELRKIPYILVVGDKEIKDKTVSVRERHKKESGIFTLNEFINKTREEIANRR